jgi:hypothetical protein
MDLEYLVLTGSLRVFKDFSFFNFSFDFEYDFNNDNFKI